MIVKNKSTFFTGALLALGFAGMLAVMFSPIFGEGRNGLVYADEMFNRLSKGSSYFIPKVAKSNENFKTTEIAVVIKLDKPEQMNPLAIKLLATAGATAGTASPELKITGNLGNVMNQALIDADDMFKNEGAKVSGRYGSDEKEVMSSWWNILKGMDKELKKQGKIAEAKIVSDVMKKAVEPAYNYYKVEAQQVSEKAGIMTGLLVFYVVYTMWWGFAIFYMFDGIGLTMKKAKVKKEV
jgi:capsid portal protein